MLLHGGELLLHIFGLMGEDFLVILRLNELLGVIERRLQIRFGEAERLRAERSSASESGLPMALRSRARWSGREMPLRCCPTMLSDSAHLLCAFSVHLFLWHPGKRCRRKPAPG
jgi:hypothetical protein